MTRESKTPFEVANSVPDKADKQTLTKENAREGLKVQLPNGSSGTLKYDTLGGSRGPWAVVRGNSWTRIADNELTNWKIVTEPPLVHTDQNKPLELPAGHPDRPEKGSMADIINCVEEFVAKWREIHG